MRKIEEKFYNVEHKLEYKKTRVLVLKDLGFIALFFLIMGILIYSPLSYWIKSGTGFILYFAIGLKEKNAIELENKFEILREFKNKK